jgi:hypothetical protein
MVAKTRNVSDDPQDIVMQPSDVGVPNGVAGLDSSGSVAQNIEGTMVKSTAEIAAKVLTANGTGGSSWQVAPGGTDPNAIHTNVAGEINGLTAKSPVVDADVVVIENSAGGLYTKAKALLSTLLTYFKADTDVASAISLKHTRSHAITATADHTSSATSGQMLKADANGLPVNATNTDAQVSAAVTASHAQSHIHDGGSAGDGSGTLAQNTSSKEPTGFLNRTDSTLSFVDATRIFTITGTNFEVWVRGVKVLKSTANVTLPGGATAPTGLYYIYYDADVVGFTLTASTTPPSNFFFHPLIATIYWNLTLALGRLADERHGIVMDGQTHSYLHESVGTRYVSGLTGTFADATFSLTQGQIDDEDIALVIGAQTQCRVFNRTGGVGYEWTAKQNAYYYASGGNIYYDNSGKTAATSNWYVAYWIFATNDIETPIWSLMGQRQDSSISAARNNNTYESLSFGQLPFKEMKLLYRVIVRNDASPYEETLDLRSVSNLPSGTYVATAHSSLTGLDSVASGHTGFITTQPDEFAALTEKTTLGASDNFLIENSVTSGSKNRVTLTNIMKLLTDLMVGPVGEVSSGAGTFGYVFANERILATHLGASGNNDGYFLYQLTLPVDCDVMTNVKVVSRRNGAVDSFDFLMSKEGVADANMNVVNILPTPDVTLTTYNFTPNGTHTAGDVLLFKFRSTCDTGEYAELAQCIVTYRKKVVY